MGKFTWSWSVYAWKEWKEKVVDLQKGSRNATVASPIENVASLWSSNTVEDIRHGEEGKYVIDIIGLVFLKCCFIYALANYPKG